jgi:ribosomal protein S25
LYGIHKNKRKMRIIENGVNYFTLQSGYINELTQKARELFADRKSMALAQLRCLLKVDKNVAKLIINILKIESFIKCTSRLRKRYEVIKTIPDDKNNSCKNLIKINDKNEKVVSEAEAKCITEKECEKEDALLDKIKKYITGKEYISASRIQAEFAVGYPRARKIIEQLEMEGLVEFLPDGRCKVK